MNSKPMHSHTTTVTATSDIRIDGTLPEDQLIALPEWAISTDRKERLKKARRTGKKRGKI